MNYKFLLELIEQISTEIIVGVCVYLWVSFRTKIKFFGLMFYRFLKVKFTQKKLVLVWNDDDWRVSELLIKKLAKENPGFNYRALKKPDDIFFYPITPKIVQLLIFIVTDVTKLSEDPKIRKKIQERILEFVDKGGTVVGTHDIIYIRVRNHLLEKAFGCQITDFRRENAPINYIIAPEYKNHPILKGLPDSFELDDGEVCWGLWNSSVKTLLKSKKSYNGRNQVPLLTIRTYSKGVLIWINSCDKYQHIRNSIAKPQKEFIQILANILDFSRNINDYLETDFSEEDTSVSS